MKTILAIDPGYDRCGVAILTKENTKETLMYSCCITTQKKDPLSVRLSTIYTAINDIIAIYKPDVLAIETLFVSVNKKTVIAVAEARGVILLIGGIHNITVIELSPQDVKIALTGAGNATKQQVQKMISLSLGIDTSQKIDDELDAIAVGFAASSKLKLIEIGLH